MLKLSKRRRREQAKQMMKRIDAVREGMVRRLALFFAGRFEPEERSHRLAESVVSRLFGGVPQLAGDELTLVEQLALEIVKTDEEIRNSAFLSLRAMLKIAGDINDFGAERRVLETIQWMKQFGEIPRKTLEPEVIKQLAASFAEKHSSI